MGSVNITVVLIDHLSRDELISQSDMIGDYKVKYWKISFFGSVKMSQFFEFE